MAESGKRQILHTATLDFGSIGAGATAELTEAVIGVAAGMVVTVSAPSLEANLIATAFASDTDEITVRVGNISAGAIDPASQDFLIAISY